MEKLLSRKLLLTLGFAACATIVAIFGDITPEAWIDLMKWLLGIYVGGNAISKIGEGIAKKNGN